MNMPHGEAYEVYQENRTHFHTDKLNKGDIIFDWLSNTNYRKY